jgi:predicted DNA-binding transcriptional regulator AlpA
VNVTDELLDAFLDELAARLAPRIAAELADRLEPTESDPWRLLNVVEVATMLGRSRRWVSDAVKNRGLPVTRLDGGALAFDPEAVRAWALDRQVPAREPSMLAPRLHPSRNGSGDPASVTRARTPTQKARS